MTSTHTKSRPTTMAVALTGAVVLTALVTGCSHGANHASATAKGAPVAVPAPTADPIVNDPKARPSVSMKDCAATSSGWAAGGTVTNSTAKSRTFTIVVSFTTKQSTVLTRGTTKVTLKGGATKNWTTAASFAKTKGTQCVLRGVSAN
jgi:hypothetical protein